MDAASGGDCRTDRFGQLVQSGSPGHARFKRLVGERRLRPHPDNIVDGIVFSEKHIFAGVCVEYSGITGMVQSEKIEKSAVLPERESVARIVGRGFVVTRQQDETSAETFAQLVAAPCIGLCFKHIG